MKKPRAMPLEIRFRQTLSGDGETSSHATIFCPQKERSVELTDCFSCMEYVKTSLDRGERSGVLICHHGHAPARSTSASQAESSAKKSLHRRFALLADSTRVSELMTGNVACVREDVSVEALAALFVERGFSGVPVVDEAGRPVGVASQTDLVRYGYENASTQVGGDESDAESVRRTMGMGFHEDRVMNATVADIMTPASLTVAEGASVSQAAAMMAFEKIHRLPVVDPLGKVVGILSSLDVLSWVASHTDYVAQVVRSYLDRH